jgi:polyisoprenoid-binding protein YceI
MLSKKWAVFALFAGVSAPALAADYTIDPEHTFPSIEMDHMGLSTWRGKFNKTSGKVVLDRTKKTGSVDIVIDASSIDWGHDVMNEHSVGADWLDAQKFPTITYKGPLKFKGDKAVSVDGALTLLGVTKPVKLSITHFTCIDHPYFKKEVCGADAQGSLNRADFGLTKYSDGKAGIINFRVQVEAHRDGPVNIKIE